MANILISDGVYMSTSSACIVDLTPPTFAGIVSASVESRGQIRTTWAAATDSTPPLRYEVYIQASTATGLFNVANIIASTNKFQYDTFTLPDGSFLVNGTTYYLGVRAVDAVGNRETNTVSLNVISTGVSVSADIYQSEGAFAINSSNQLQGTLWCLKNSILAKTGNAVMGTASYQVYDKTGAAVAGMGASGISADSNGQYKITPVASTLNSSLDHYMVLVTINVDGADRQGYVALIEQAPEYEVEGVVSVDNANLFKGSFWVTANEQIRTTGLGTASYSIYDSSGTLVSGMSQTGITADAAGLFKITPVTSNLSSELTHYAVKVSITVDGIVRSEFLPIVGKVPEYECYGIFSINALNQLQGTLHCEADGDVRKGASLGAASYQVFDATGVAVSGLTQTGITADANGRFIITPVSAALLTDLTHYSVTIKIIADGVERESFSGFNLLGT